MARTTTRSGKREMNPTDAYRKLQRKKEVSKNKKERKKVREFSAMVRNPDLMVEEVHRMEALDVNGKLSENDQKRLANLRVTHRVLLKKKKTQEDAVRKQTEEEEAAKMSRQEREKEDSSEEEDAEEGDGSDPPPPPPPPPPGPPPPMHPTTADGSSGAGFGMHSPPPPPPLQGMYGIPGAPVPGMPGMHYPMPPPPPPRGPPPPPPRGGVSGTQSLPPPPPPRRPLMAGTAATPIGVYGPGQALSSGGEGLRGKGKARGGGARGGVLDPLDPEGEGYTERPYNLGKQQGPQQRPDPLGVFGPSQGPETMPPQSSSGNPAAKTTVGESGGSGTLGPIQGPARPPGLKASATVSEAVLRMKPTHLRVHRPSGPRGTSTTSAAAAAARGGLGGVGVVRRRASPSEKVAFSVPRPAGTAFLTPRSTRSGPGAGASSSSRDLGALSSVPRPASATFLKPAVSAAHGGGGGGASKAVSRRTAKEPVETKKAGVNQEYDSFMEEMKGLGAF